MSNTIAGTSGNGTGSDSTMSVLAFFGDNRSDFDNAICSRMRELSGDNR